MQGFIDEQGFTNHKEPYFLAALAVSVSPVIGHSGKNDDTYRSIWLCLPGDEDLVPSSKRN